MRLYEGPRQASKEYSPDEISKLMEEVARIAKEARANVPAFTVGPILRRAGDAMKFGLLNRVEPPATGVTIALPEATAADGGTELDVSVLGTAGSVTYVGKGAPVNGLESFSPGVEFGLRRFRWDGLQWFTQPALAAIGWTLSNIDGQAFTAAGGEETVTWPTLVSQEGGVFDDSTPTIVTIPEGGAGRYVLAAHAGFANAVGTNFALKIKVDGVSVARESARGGGVSTLATTLSAATIESLEPGNVLIVTVDLDTVNETSSTAQPGMRFSGVRVSGAQ